jgi:hypothetical protein
MINNTCIGKSMTGGFNVVEINIRELLKERQ